MYIFIQKKIVQTCVIYSCKKNESKVSPRLRWEDNIVMDLKEIGVNTGDLMALAQDRDYWRALL